MRYFVQPFDIVGKEPDASSQQSDEFYMHTFAKVSDIKSHISGGMHIKDDSEFTREKYKEYAKSYHGYGSGGFGIHVRPKEVMVDYTILYAINYETEDTSQWGIHFKYDFGCELKIWLTTNDIFKLYGV